MRGSIWAVGFPVCPALLVPARFVSHAPARAAARRFACACRVATRSSVHPSHPVNKFLHVKGGGNIFKNLDSLLGLKPLFVPPQIVGQVYATASGGYRLRLQACVKTKGRSSSTRCNQPAFRAMHPHFIEENSHAFVCLNISNILLTHKLYTHHTQLRA